MFLIVKRRHAYVAVAACVALVAGMLSLGAHRGQTARAVAAAADNWGMSFQQEGQPPIANASAEELAQYDTYYLGDTTKKTIYLTFDAGYENGYTPAILGALKKHRVQAAFFIVGHYLETAPDLVKRMVAEGHIVGNHTYHHPDMSAIRDETVFRAELEQTEVLYREIVGAEMPKLYRPPQGKYSVENLKTAKKLGYKTLFWSLAYVDWYTDKQPTAQQAFDKLIPRVHNGAVVLLHSTSATNAQILDELLTKWEQLGYTFGKISELCGV